MLRQMEEALAPALRGAKPSRDLAAITAGAVARLSPLAVLFVAIGHGGGCEEGLGVDSQGEMHLR